MGSAPLNILGPPIAVHLTAGKALIRESLKDREKDRCTIENQVPSAVMTASGRVSLGAD